MTRDVNLVSRWAMATDMAKLLAREAASLAAFPDRGRRYRATARPERAVSGAPGDVERFWAKVDRSGPHWLWTGRSVQGKAYARWRGRDIPAARASWQVHHGPIPPGKYVRVTCGLNCVRPDHLRLSHRRSGDPYALPPGNCSLCERAARAKGLCRMHWQQDYRRRKKEHAVKWDTDTEGQYLCTDCRRGLDDTCPVLVLGDDGMVPICGRCSRNRRLRMEAAIAMDLGMIEGTG